MCTSAVGSGFGVTAPPSPQSRPDIQPVARLEARSERFGRPQWRIVVEAIDAYVVTTAPEP
jgi:hypothetical protein